ncbi:hypothetical protein ACOSP7_019941 [Xanthoceras sorbifolium]
MTTTKFDIEKFDRNMSFTMWQVKMRAILIHNGLHQALLGKDKLPSIMDEAKKQEMDDKALASIQLCLSNEVLREVMQEKTAKDLWDKLESLYVTKNLTTKLVAKHRLYTLSMAEGASIKSHIDEFSTILMDLGNMEISYDDEDQALMLLRSLPPSYKHFRDTLIYSRQTLKLEDVKAALFSKELIDKELGTSRNDSPAEGLLVRGRTPDKSSSSNQRSRSRSKSRHRNLTCNYCKKKGHTKSECFKLKNKQQNKDQKRDEPAEASIVQNQEQCDLLLVCADEAKARNEWILDTACSFHMCPNRDYFSTYKSVQGGVVLMGNNHACKIAGMGTIKIKMHDGVVRTLTDVRHIPDLKRNLISLSTLDSNGYKFTGGDGVLKVAKGSLIVMKAEKIGKLYILKGSTVTGAAAVSTSSLSDSDVTRLWHMRLGHMSEKGLSELSRRGLLCGQSTSKLDFCEHCIFGKQKRVSFSTAIHRTKGTLDYIHSDLWGPARVPSKGGARYMLTFIDDYSRKVWVYFLKQKNDVFTTFKQWKALVEKQTGRKIKRLRTDNGLEFCQGDFIEFCKNEGIVRHLTVRGTPQQNGVAERMNRTLLEKVRCMLSNSGLSKDFWAEAASTACHLVNRSPSTAIGIKTPEELWSGKPAEYSDLKVFGCPAYAHINDGKLEPRSKRCIFIGYPSGVKGYKLWCPDPKSPKVIISRDVVFDESAMLYPVKETSTRKEIFVSSNTNAASSSKQVEFEVENEPSLQNRVQMPTPIEEEETPQSEEEDSIARHKPPRKKRRPQRLADYVSFALAVAEDTNAVGEPSTYSEAISCDDSAKWLVAMQEEVESLHKNRTWDLVKPPKDKKIVGCKWVFKRKEGIPGVEDAKYKARLVAKGYSQVHGVDFNDVFSPVVKHSSIRVLLALVAMHNLELEQLDVKTAFLHGELEETIYMQQPEGFEIEGKKDHVCLLKKSLYGLKQSPRQWYKRFDSFMISHGYSRSQYDSCVYFRKLKDGSFVYLLLYVDDMLIAAKDMFELNKLKSELSGEFEMKDLGAAKKILGMEIRRDKAAGKLYLTQKSFVEKVLERFGMKNAKPVSTPLAAHFKLSAAMSPQSDNDIEYMSHVPYSSAVGSLMYAMICTRPDIAHAVSVVSRYMSNPGKEHWQAVKWIMRYLRGTTDSCLEFGRSKGHLVGYVDSDYAGDLDRRRSITGYVFTLGDTAISWKATLQSTVALSTTEAEYMAVVEAIKQAIWMRGSFGELSLDHKVIVVHCDSQSAIHLTKDQMFHERTKHIDVKYHFVRDIISQCDISVKKIGTADNPADMLTKSLSVSKFRHCLDLVGIYQK